METTCNRKVEKLMRKLVFTTRGYAPDQAAQALLIVGAEAFLIACRSPEELLERFALFTQDMTEEQLKELWTCGHASPHPWRAWRRNKRRP